MDSTGALMSKSVETARTKREGEESRAKQQHSDEMWDC